MKIKSIAIFVSLLVLISCTIMKNNGEEKMVSGIITATTYLIPVPCKLSLYSKGKLLQETKTDNKGYFSFGVPEKRLNEECFIVLEPLQKSVYKDTTREGSTLDGVQVLDIATDTFSYNSVNLIADIELRKYQIMVIEKLISH